MAFPALDVLVDEPLAPHTRFAIGGPADLFLRSREPEALAAAVELSLPGGSAQEALDQVVRVESHRAQDLRAARRFERRRTVAVPCHRRRRKSWRATG